MLTLQHVHPPLLSLYYLVPLPSAENCRQALEILQQNGVGDPEVCQSTLVAAVTHWYAAATLPIASHDTVPTYVVGCCGCNLTPMSLSTECDSSDTHLTHYVVPVPLWTEL